MTHYLISTYGSAVGAPPPTPDAREMQERLARVVALEADMDESGVFLFGGGLADPTEATVVDHDEGGLSTTDGPFAEASEHVAGFYIIDADDDDEALQWGRRVAEALGRPIEVRAFHATGRVQDHLDIRPST